MSAAAWVAYSALLLHLQKVDFPPPKPFRFKYSALKLASAGYVPGKLLGAHVEAINYLGPATHGGKGLDIGKGKAAVLTVQCLSKIVVPCNETSNYYLTPSVETRTTLREALDVTENSDHKTLTYQLDRAVAQLEHLKDATGARNNWKAAEMAARSQRISGALAAQLFCATRDRNAIKRPISKSGWGQVTKADKVSGIRSIAALFGLVPEFLRLPDGSRVERTQGGHGAQSSVGGPDGWSARDWVEVFGVPDFGDWGSWIRSPDAKKRRRAVLHALLLLDAALLVLSSEPETDICVLFAKLALARSLPPDLVGRVSKVARQYGGLARNQWTPSIQEATAIDEELNSLLSHLEDTSDEETSRRLSSLTPWLTEIEDTADALQHTRPWPQRERFAGVDPATKLLEEGLRKAGINGPRELLSKAIEEAGKRCNLPEDIIKGTLVAAEDTRELWLRGYLLRSTRLARSVAQCRCFCLALREALAEEGKRERLPSRNWVLRKPL